MTTTDAFLSLGAQAPESEVASAEGGPVLLPSLWSERPLVLIFLCPLDTGYGADNAIRLRDADEAYQKAGAELVAVVPNQSNEAAAFKQQWKIPYQILCDPGEALYRAFGVTDESPGSFVIDTGGKVRYLHRNNNGLDSPSTWDLIAAVCELTGAAVEKPASTPAEAEDPSVESASANGAAELTPGDNRLPNYTCAKCGYTDCDVQDVSTTSGMLSRVFNSQHRRLSAVTCVRCTYTEFFRTESGALRNIFDLFAGS
ncbi:MAG: redoxin domain-containing protein [Chloroflexi bacterium]|nr:redoxin domain-containing protein [Chloroflexota bacterium]